MQLKVRLHQPCICFKTATTQTFDTGVTIVSSNMSSETKKYAVFVNVTEQRDHSIQTVFSHWMFICNHVKYGIKIYMESLFSFACSKILTCISEWLYMSNRSLELGISDLTRFLLHIQISCGTLTVCLWKKNYMTKQYNMWNLCWTTWQWDTFFLSIFVFSWFNPTPGNVELVADKVVLGEVFLWIFWFPHQQCSTNAPYSHFIHLPLTWQNLRKKMTGSLNKPHPHPIKQTAPPSC